MIRGYKFILFGFAGITSKFANLGLEFTGVDIDITLSVKKIRTEETNVQSLGALK
jgi:hypothetical protein